MGNEKSQTEKTSDHQYPAQPIEQQPSSQQPARKPSTLEVEEHAIGAGE